MSETRLLLSRSLCSREHVDLVTMRAVFRRKQEPSRGLHLTVDIICFCLSLFVTGLLTVTL